MAGLKNDKAGWEAFANAMDAETVAALKGSILKWEKIVDGTGVDEGADNCPLCAKFCKNDNDQMEWCRGCPVAAWAGQSGCHGTPYTHFCLSGSDDASRAAKAELAFLKSLLPASEKVP